MRRRRDSPLRGAYAPDHPEPSSTARATGRRSARLARMPTPPRGGRIRPSTNASTRPATAAGSARPRPLTTGHIMETDARTTRKILLSSVKDALGLPSTRKPPDGKKPFSMGMGDDPVIGISKERLNREYELISKSISRVVDAVGREAIANATPGFREQYGALELVTASFNQLIQEMRLSRPNLSATLHRLCTSYRRLFKKILDSVIDIQQQCRRRCIKTETEAQNKLTISDNTIRKLRMQLRIAQGSVKTKDSLISIYQQAEKQIQGEYYRLMDLVGDHFQMTLGIDIRNPPEVKDADEDEDEDEDKASAGNEHDLMAAKLTNETAVLTRRVKRHLLELKRRQDSNSRIEERLDRLQELKTKIDREEDARNRKRGVLPRPRMKSVSTETEGEKTGFFVMLSLARPSENAQVVPRGKDTCPPPRPTRAEKDRGIGAEKNRGNTN
eukprot:CAMPEP_0167827034 /NCGR_PEP_ID=MMETSP0112_2-20121227/10442_1 /TAXON_ID=91324 /ORGANISM="Lotharella globosa, Strain CCCM811" /LENGTH=443 /DNA_ID=CAMNT_0007729697 /DNA_START=33 /DNA_END=1361 /DNA_ORIENTATION=+